MSIGTPLVAYPILRRFGKLPRPDAASIAAHYGSVSVVTFAVGASYLTRQGVEYEDFMSVFLVFLELPALIILKTAVEEHHESRKPIFGAGFRRFRRTAEQFLLGDADSIEKFFHVNRLSSFCPLNCRF